MRAKDLKRCGHTEPAARCGGGKITVRTKFLLEGRHAGWLLERAGVVFATTNPGSNPGHKGCWKSCPRLTAT